MLPQIFSQLCNATLETLYMVSVASFFSTVLGLPLGVALYITKPNNLMPHKTLHQSLAALINMTRSIPFVILMIAVIPFTRFIVGSSIGTNAAIVPLSLCAIPFVARIVENALLEVNSGLIEAAVAMGATYTQIIRKVLIPEALPGIINGITLTIVNLVGYSAMAGAVGGGGLGDLAIRYGYQRFDVSTMLTTILIMIALVQGIQLAGDTIANRYTHKK